MIAKALIVFFGVVLLAMPAMAQDNDSYERGYDAGYNNGPPPSDHDPIGSLYGQGYQNGQGDADDDERADERAIIQDNGGSVAGGPDPQY